MRYSTIVATALALSASAASAATISEKNDFSNGATPFLASIDTLDIGTNTVSGVLGGTCINFDCNTSVGPGEDNQDSFKLVVPSGSSISSVSLFGTGSGPAGFELSYSYNPIVNGSFVPFSFDRQGYTQIPGSDSLTLPSSGLGKGEYIFSAFGGSALSDGAYSANWTLTIDVASTNVAPVPLPAGFPLLAAGLIGLSAVALRRKST